MAIKGEEGGLEYSFEFKCADFEIEFKGDLNFVQAQLYKYEPKILVKIAQIVPAEKPQGQQQPQRQPQPQPQRQQPQPQPQRQPQPQPQRQQQQPPRQQQPQKQHRDRPRGGGGYKRPTDDFKKDEKKPTREPDYVENRERMEEPPKPVQVRLFSAKGDELRGLLDRYRPQTSHDRMMIFAYYIEEKVNQEFGSGEMQECFQALGERPSGNLPTILSNGARSGFLLKEEKGGKARYRLTFKGKRYVENGLRLD